MRGFGIDARRPLRQQAVAGHRKEDARLAVLKHQQHGGHRDDRAERDDPADAREARRSSAQTPADRRRPAACTDHPGQHDADDDVDDRADRQAAENADRQVPLRIFRLLGCRRDRVEADVREKDDRRALMDAGKPVRRKRRVVGRLSMFISPTPMNSASAASLTTTITLLRVVLSRAPRSSSHVTTITMPNAGRFTRIGTPASRGAVLSRPCTSGIRAEERGAIARRQPVRQRRDRARRSAS